MSASDDRLRRVLELERLRGYNDSAVMGGLDKMLRALLGDGALLPGTAAHEALIALPARGYAALQADERARWVERTVRALERRPVVADPAPARSAVQPPAAGPTLPSSNGSTGRPSVAARPQALRPVPPVKEIAMEEPRTRALRRDAAPPPAHLPAARGARALPSAARRPPATPRARTPAKVHPSGLAAPVTALPGVSTVTAGKLAKLGIETVRDLLWHLPARYEDYSKVRPVAELIPGESQTVIGSVWSSAETQMGRFKRGSEVIVGDDTGNVRAVWFAQTWVAKGMKTNDRVALSGKVTVFQGVRQMESPEWELLEGDLADAMHTGRLIPVYPLTAGLSARTLRRLIRDTLDLYLPTVTDPLPEEVRARHNLLGLAAALTALHTPESEDAAGAARARLGFDEMLTLQLAVLHRRAQRQQGPDAPVLALTEETRDAFIASLPFPLTGAQERVIGEIAADLSRSTPMSRLVQGDVGSGKTVVAATALLAAVANGYQGAIMAPTEILAEQHFRTLCRLFGGESGDASVCECVTPVLGRPLRIALLRGGLGAKAKREAQRAIAAGEVDIAVGTQALIQGDLAPPRLGLAIVDEQHRFGVAQRAALRGPSDGSTAHLLVMTATPIPRTLALTVYGDLDVSLIDEMPPGRMPVKTLVVQSHERDAAYNFIIEQLRDGRQAFVICPLVEESETIEVRAATAEYERLQEVFTSASLALLHGRMPNAKKDEVMREFRDQLHDVLVSTAVVEVGIDVPNATVMMIEGAQRFGLAQLHQFRGRVGRGQHQSYCFLMADAVSEEARERLALMEDIADGFRLAEEDLRLRGEGDYFGTRQSGLPRLKVASLADTPLLERARGEATTALASTPAIDATVFRGYAESMERILRSTGGDVS